VGDLVRVHRTGEIGEVVRIEGRHGQEWIYTVRMHTTSREPDVRPYPLDELAPVPPVA
jgi:hypothetical protein